MKRIRKLSLLSFLFLAMLLYNLDVKYSEIKLNSEKIDIQENGVLNDNKLKYILQWTDATREPFKYMGVGQQGFIDRKCEFSNCYVTDDRNFFDDISKFDVIAFHGAEVSEWSTERIIPKKRSPHQKYTFATMESASNFPVCYDEMDNFFNWTWTYRLDSDSKYGFINIRDATGVIIGPKIEMHWIKLQDMDPVKERLKEILRKKTKAAAWFVSNCLAIKGRDSFFHYLQIALKKYSLKVDVYGKCGPLKCARDRKEECFQLIKKDYYFYMAMENSFSKDYVTEKLLIGLKYNAIPIVYGGANYTRFMPDGIYLNAVELGVERLANKIKFLIDNPEEYEQYFRWRNHYSYHDTEDSAETDDYCGFCKLLHDEERVKEMSMYENFKEWWNEPGRCP